MSSWSILDMNPLSDTLFANTFSHSVCCLFVLWMVTFAVENLFSWMESHWFILLFFPLLEKNNKKILLRLMSKSILPMFSSRSFMASGFTLKYMIYFMVVFVDGMRKESSVILVHVAVRFSQHHLLKRLSFPHCVFSPPLS